uniref:Transcription factor IIIA n=1 Tax=Gouania willdenowi TaxID=441366 RepID=A0A8C5DDD3_GOUWI
LTFNIISTLPYKRYICSFRGCLSAYNKQWKLDAHLCKHTGVKPHACPWPGCVKSFCSRYHLTRHELTHTGEKPFPCTEAGCTQSFTTNANRATHVTRIHAQEAKKYVCKFENCGLEFKKHNQLKSHMCEQHTELPPYTCPHPGCSARFTFPSKLKRHEKVHRGYPCTEEGCAFTGKTWTELLKHKKEQHRPVVTCRYCSKVFRDTSSMEQHLYVHLDTRVVFRCPRDSCDSSFTTLFNLQSHIASFHENLRPFLCLHPDCGKAFAMKKSLQRHSIIHDPTRRKAKKPRPKRSLASRLSGFKDVKRVQGKDSTQNASVQPCASDLASILQDASLSCVMDSETFQNALAAPLAV